MTGAGCLGSGGLAGAITGGQIPTVWSSPRHGATSGQICSLLRTSSIWQDALKDSCRRSCRPRCLASHLLTAEVRAVSIKRDGQVYKAAHHRPAEKHCRDPLRPQSAGAAMGQHGVNKGGMMGQDQYYSNPWPSPRRKLRTCLAKTHVPMDGILRMIPGPGEEAQRCPA